MLVSDFKFHGYMELKSELYSSALAQCLAVQVDNEHLSAGILALSASQDTVSHGL